MNEFVRHEKYGEYIRQLLSVHKDVSIAVSYWSEGILGKLGIDNLIANAEHLPIRVICDLEHPACHYEPIEKLLESNAIEVRTIPGLHAKVWISEKSAIVGSANASRSALHFLSDTNEGNVEAGIRTTNRETLNSINLWFDELWKSERSKPVTDFDIESEKRKNNIREQSNSSDRYPQLIETNYFENSEILNAVEAWKNRCLLNRTSIFTNEPIWSLGTFSELRNRVFDVPKRITKFEEFLMIALRNAPKNSCKLMAELYWVFCLVHQVTARSKIDNVNMIWNMSRDHPIPDEHEMFNILRTDSGFVSPGQALAQKPAAFRFLILLMCKFFKGTFEQRKEMLDQNEEFTDLCDDVHKMQESQARHIILFLLYPRLFLAIINSGHKRAIATFKPFRTYLGRTELSETPTLYEIDLRLSAIRYNLEKLEGTRIDFYGDSRFNGWKR